MMFILLAIVCSDSKNRILNWRSVGEPETRVLDRLGASRLKIIHHSMRYFSFVET